MNVFECLFFIIRLPVIGGIVINLVWLFPLLNYSAGARALFKGGVKWKNPKLWAIVAGVILGFALSVSAASVSSAVQGTIRQP